MAKKEIIEYLEKHNDNKNFHKFYLVTKNSSGEFVICKGEIGSKGWPNKTYSKFSVVKKKINDKINKGYIPCSIIPKYLLDSEYKFSYKPNDDFIKLLKAL